MRLTQVQFAEMQRLAEVETEGNVSQMIRKAVDGFLQARSKPYRVGIENPQVTYTTPPGRIVPGEAGPMVEESLVDRPTPREAVAEAVASARAEGLEPSAKGLEVVEQVAAGEIAVEEAVEVLVEHHTVPAAQKLRAPGKPMSKVDAQRAMRERKHG